MRIEAVHAEPNGGSAEAGGGLVKVLLSTLSESWLADARAEGIALGSLDAGTSLILHTRNSEYRLTVLDGERGEVLLKGGLLFPEDTEACILGSAAQGALKIRWLGIGLRMEISTHGRTISTSPVQSLTIEHAHGSSAAPAVA
jgi:hypothetical protein